MPTVLRVAGYRFFFFSNERGEPAHGFRASELGQLRRLVFEHRILFQEKWNEHFSR